MPFESVEFAWGPYTATWGGTDVGLVEGPRVVEQTAEGIDVRSDLFGSSVIDGVYTGGNMFLLMTPKEWKVTYADTDDILWPFAEMGQSGVHGRSYHDLAKQTILTAVPGTLAADVGPNIRTITKAIYAPGHVRRDVMGSEERDIPMVFRMYPSGVLSTSVLTWYDDTAS